MSRVSKNTSESKIQHERPHFSKATLEVAQRNLKEFESRSDEGFLIRAKIDKKLSSL